MKLISIVITIFASSWLPIQVHFSHPMTVYDTVKVGGAASGANRVSCESLYVYIQVFTESQPLIYLGKVFDVYRLEQ